MISLSEVLFLDIETVSQHRYFEETNETICNLFMKRFQWLKDRDSASQWIDIYRENACLNAEFGKILSITVGSMRSTKSSGDMFYVKTFIDRDESKVLKAFSAAVEMGEYKAFVAHNGYEFDFPYLHRRYLVHDMPVPVMLNPFGKKPWDLNAHLYDTMKIWSGVQYSHKISLDLLAECFGVPSPKSEMDGSQIHEMYWSMFDEGKELPFDVEEKVFAMITRYNQGDVKTLVNVFCRMMGIPMVNELQMAIL